MISGGCTAVSKEQEDVAEVELSNEQRVVSRPGYKQFSR